MGKSLVIVESPAKARTISKFLGEDFLVAPSIGHIRDLPQNAAEIPASYKSRPWARLGVDIENDFTPLYVIPSGKKEQVKELRSLLSKAEKLYLATDEDREGESISWHLQQVLKPSVPVFRLVFHEITDPAIRKAMEAPRAIDEHIVKAQEARRILDRLFGYEVSPLLWKKIRPRLSAGRVQSVAVRLIVERESSRMAFRRARFWNIRAVFSTDPGSFTAVLLKLGGKSIATSNDFEPTSGRLKARSSALHLDEHACTSLLERLVGLPGTVTRLEERKYRERPAPPFTTSTLQQEANRKSHWSASRTMRVAQRLYENGWITYMRTDSTTLSDEAVQASRQAISCLYGAEFLPRKKRVYRTRSKGAQEAHEAIRPAGDEFRTPEQARTVLPPEESRLYDLIWKRTLASQMKDARGTRTRIQVTVGDAIFQARGKTITFPGFRRAYIEDLDENTEHLQPSATALPKVSLNQRVSLQSLEPQQHETKPTPRLTEASLVKELEARGIGRPSTYATIISTIKRRGYIFKKGNALVPTFTAIAVTKLLSATLSDLVDYAFTAHMEDELDRIAMGEQDPVKYLRAFYMGSEGPGLKARLEAALAQVDARQICTIPITGTLSGSDTEPIVARVGRFGAYLSKGDIRADIPDNMPPDEMNETVARGMLEQSKQWPRELGLDPESGKPVNLCNGPFGFYVQLGEKEGRRKPSRAGLLKGMNPENVDLDTALGLLSLPRRLGKHPRTGETVIASNGRYGPYLKCGNKTRSIGNGGNLLDITLERAVAILDAPTGKRHHSGRGPSRVMGKHPDSGDSILLRSGRYGPYVTDGRINASLPKNASPDELTLDQALELLEKRAARLANGPRRPGYRRRS